MTLHRVAIVGTGGIATRHMQAPTAMGERVQVVAAVDVDQARVEAFRAAHGIPRAYANVEPMLAAEQPGLVHIATPPPTPRFTAARRLVGRMRRIGRHVR